MYLSTPDGGLCRPELLFASHGLIEFFAYAEVFAAKAFLDIRFDTCRVKGHEKKFFD